MPSKIRAHKASQEWKQPKDAPKSVNFHEEYHKALRTKSYVDFFHKAQLLANKPSIYSNHNNFSEILLEPDQKTIHSVIDTPFLSKAPELKSLMLSYFEISAEASFICSHLLQIINQVQCNYQVIERALGIMHDYDDSPEKLKLISFELNSFIFSNNPFSNLKNHDFKLISDENSSLLSCLKSMRKKEGSKVKPVAYLKKTSEVCVAAWDFVAVTANVIAEQTLTTLSMGPTIINFPCKSLINKRELPHLRFSRRGFLSNVCDQLDVAAKGTYILNKDFETMTRLVARLYDEIEHKRAMVQFFLDKKGDKLSLLIVKELEKSDAGFRKQVEELKEHVYLCLVTINRARCLVTQEMTKTCTEGIGM